MRLHGQNHVQKKKNSINSGKESRNSKEIVLKLTNVQNEKLDKLTNITQNLENKLNGIQKRWLNMKIS